jgi:hypothetical protein
LVVSMFLIHLLTILMKISYLKLWLLKV